MWRRTVARSAVVAENLRRFSISASPSLIPGPCIVHKRGADILHDPWFNKGVDERMLEHGLWHRLTNNYFWNIQEQDTGFPLTERDRLGIRGLLPPRVISFEQQYERFSEFYISYNPVFAFHPLNYATTYLRIIFVESYRSLEKNTAGQPDSVVSLAKWRILNRLHDRNETLYYRVLIDNIKDFAPIIYTPTVGLVCQNYSGLFRRPRGMYFSAKDKGEMMSMIYNWPAPEVDMIVLTDGSRILGLGDLGVQGIGIPIGKLDMYVAAAGINPQRVLPIMLDVGTNNQKLLEDRLYLGLRERRLEGEEYISVVDELMEALHARWPKAIVQGTAGVALAGLLGTVRAQGQPLSDFVNQKIVVVGAGSAGLGVLNMAFQAVSRMTGKTANPQFYLIDKDGLMTKERAGVDPSAAPFAKAIGEVDSLGLREGSDLLEVVKKVKPHVLLGLSGVGGIFNEQVLTIFYCGNGKVGHVNQANNMYLFPGIGLGALLSGAHIISDGMLQAAAECLASYMTEADIQKGILYPSINSIRNITAEVGAAVLRTAVVEELAEGRGEVGPKELGHMSKEETVEYVTHNMWYPIYGPLIHEK
ncbi:Malic enzyme, NAD-binding [Cynara cardunculus var. scolymus]|uniref:Malic enzyme, NAD-binding n=1 Tax=Cynara cardunculus var. scolymus TaxID=59895 RepID=A0A103XEG0_CYNCS|nr:Malic enzyme, NAD-binding [Cynara cardunculus var. scolymus]